MSKIINGRFSDKVMIITVAGEKKDIEQGTTVSKLIVDENVENPE